MTEEEVFTVAPKDSEKDELLPSRSKSSPSSGCTFWLVFTAAVIVFGSSFQFGYGTSCINGPETVKSTGYCF